MDSLIRRTNAVDRPALEALWEEAFAESGAWFFEEIAAQGWCVEQDGLCAMAFALPQTLYTDKGEFPAAYLYGVATAQTHRGKGLATALLRRVEDDLRKNGVTGAVLVPAEQSLFRLYDRMGYRVWSYRPNVQDLSGGAPCSAEDYLELRKRLLQKPFLQPAADVAAGYRLYQTADGIYAADERGEICERIPVSESAVPFSLAKAFTPDFPARGYFALALQ